MSSGFAVKVLQPPSARVEVELEQSDSFTIGRDRSCDVVLPSAAVSRFHVRIHRDGRGLWLADQSSNGTRVGGDQVNSLLVPLPPRTDLQVGPYTLQVEDRNAEPEAPTPELRRRIHRRLLEHLDLAALDVEQLSEFRLRSRVIEALEQIVEDIPESHGSQAAQARLVAEIADEALGLGPLQALLDDESVSEIMVLDPNTIYVERAGKIELTTLRFMDEESCRAAIERIVTPLGRRIDESTPLVDARLSDGSRVNAVIPPLAVRGPCITIRKFARDPLKMSDLVSLGSLSKSMARFLQRCVRAKKNLVISGGTGSGKTTLLNVLSAEIASDERIVTIEDAAELRLHQPHVVSLESRPTNLEGQGAYSIRDLVKNALRMRPDRILVGECRAGEAIDMLQAMNTGHEGSMTTTHANSVREALKRIETLCLMSGLDLPTRAIREQIAASVHVVVQQMRFSDGSRRITSVAEVAGLDDEGEVLVNDVFLFERTGTARDGAVVGTHRRTGYVPTFLDEFIRRGLIDDGGYL
jgi:pilus assembly protein CpaF